MPTRTPCRQRGNLTPKQPPMPAQLFPTATSDCAIRRCARKALAEHLRSIRRLNPTGARALGFDCEHCVVYTRTNDNQMVEIRRPAKTSKRAKTEDVAPRRYSRPTTNDLRQDGVPGLPDWPPAPDLAYASNLSPVEHLWHLFEMMFSERTPFSLQEFKRTTVEAFGTLSEGDLRAIGATFSGRLRAKND